MLSTEFSFLFDAGLPLGIFLFGIGSATLTFVVVVVLEAIIMYKSFPGLSLKKCGIFSVTVNIVSSTLSLSVLYWASTGANSSGTVSDRIIALLVLIVYATVLASFKFKYLEWMALGFVLTVISEFGCLVNLLKPRPLPAILRYTVLSNIASLFPVLLSFLPWLVLSLFLA